MAEEKCPFRLALWKAEKSITSVLPKGWTYQQLGTLAMSFVPKWKQQTDRQGNPIRVSYDSFVSAVIKAAQCALLPDGRRGHLKVRWSSRLQCHEVVFEPGYQGLIELVKKANPKISVFTAACLYSEDKYHAVRGNPMVFAHEEPRPGTPRGTKQAAYALTIQTDGGADWETIDLAELAKIRNCSSSKDRHGNLIGPHKDWEDEMDKKAAIKRLAKRLDQTAELAAAIAADNEQFDPQRASAPRVVELPAAPPEPVEIDTANKAPPKQPDPFAPED